MADVSEMVGRVMRSVTNQDNVELIFEAEDGSKWKLYHEQDCCEYVSIEDICGDLQDLIGAPLLLSEEVSNAEEPPSPEGYHESYTWTFYKFATIKGAVTVRWFGSSNGYYSEGVSFSRLTAKGWSRWD